MNIVESLDFILVVIAVGVCIPVTIAIILAYPWKKNEYYRKFGCCFSYYYDLCLVQICNLYNFRIALGEEINCTEEMYRLYSHIIVCSFQAWHHLPLIPAILLLLSYIIILVPLIGGKFYIIPVFSPWWNDSESHCFSR